MVIFVVLTAAVVAIVLSKPEIGSHTSSKCSPSNLTAYQKNVRLFPESSRTFDIEYAKTASQQETGLSYRQCFPENGALLFLYPTDDKFGIWMKGMHFPIDVIWLDKDKKVVTIEKSMEPSSYPKIFYPDQNARYVIELNKGTADGLKAKVGSTFNW